MKLSEMVELSAKREFDKLELKYPGVAYYLEKTDVFEKDAWKIVLDELSDEIFKLAGNGLPIQGQRRIAKALGIPAPEAPEQKLGDKAE